MAFRWRADSFPRFMLAGKYYKNVSLYMGKADCINPEHPVKKADFYVCETQRGRPACDLCSLIGVFIIRCLKSVLTSYATSKSL